MAKITKNDVLSYLENSNMLEISELIKDIEEKFDVSAAAPVAVAGVAAPAAGDVVAEAKSDFDIELTSSLNHLQLDTLIILHQML